MPLEYRALWNIPHAGPSVSTFHFLTANEAGRQMIVGRVQAFFADISAYLPDEVSVAFDAEITEIDTNTGQLVDVFPITPGTTVDGADTGPWAAGAGLRVVWSTGAIRNGRRVRGATFLVPVRSNSFNNDGTPGAATVSAINTAAATMINGLSSDGSPLVVYSRPKPGLPGVNNLVSSGSVAPVAGTLRSRKY